MSLFLWFCKLLLATAALCVTAHELVDATGGIDQL